MPRLGIRLPADVIDALKAYAETRNLSVSEALRGLIEVSLGELAEYETVVVGLDETEIAALDRIRGELSRPDMIRALLAVFGREQTE
ncbi:MAG: hypothetical protein B7Y36_11125 [Novosphingobium sp. 28-62-57]|uniref:ribbon-helix-helix protein, CopG family n=1 Tax=unclassified Novosphingobium TaxID=2644732 RepID=UPI000BC3CA6C|nr:MULTISPECIES: ribbon-helix-helix protein, CopG family [unclassified Novosphingobium]OYZ09935.1 MAG: hypothetical protein B7Y36_11125 [Novosphingobium sp. 28-62-57]HQS71097.1 ribbon-helix-helix protein, CopG family [Novosphingobium sp.]